MKKVPNSSMNDDLLNESWVRNINQFDRAPKLKLRIFFPYKPTEEVVKRFEKNTGSNFF